jgi:hypothetical protein
MWGTTWLYKFTDEAGNVFTWFASSPVNDEDKVLTIKDTVKKHEEYKGIKQTVMTRCRVVAYQTGPVTIKVPDDMVNLDAVFGEEDK